MISIAKRVIYKQGKNYFWDRVTSNSSILLLQHAMCCNYRYGPLCLANKNVSYDPFGFDKATLQPKPLKPCLILILCLGYVMNYCHSDQHEGKKSGIFQQSNLDYNSRIYNPGRMLLLGSVSVYGKKVHLGSQGSAEVLKLPPTPTTPSQSGF